MKCFIGNYDGSRRAMVCAPTKVAARSILGIGRKDFDDYYHQVEPREPAKSRPGVVFLTPFDKEEWAERVPYKLPSCS